jgi:hypothetical protein
MKVSEAFPSNFLKAEDLGGIDSGRSVKGIIKDVEPWKDKDGNGKINLGFTNSAKRLLLNKTNARTVAKAYGDDTAGWVGRPVIIYVAMVQYMDDMVEALRLRIPQGPSPAAPPPPLTPPPMAFAPEEPVPQPPQFTSEQYRNKEFVSGLQRPEDLNDEIPF